MSTNLMFCQELFYFQTVSVQFLNWGDKVDTELEHFVLKKGTLCSRVQHVIHFYVMGYSYSDSILYSVAFFEAKRLQCKI